MGRLLRWILGLLSALAIWRLWSRRRREAPVADVETVPVADPADELRRKLAETRDEPAAETADAVTAADESLEDRRARVHSKAQEAMDAMRDVEETP
jgi:hypothetical protein